MGTRSYIGYEDSDGQVTATYCHSDGYLEHNGVVLNKHWKDLETVKANVHKFGYISYIDDNGMAWNPPNEDTESEIKYFKTRDNYLNWLKKDWMDIEFAYLFGLDGQWQFVEKGMESTQWTSLAEQLK